MFRQLSKQIPLSIFLALLVAAPLYAGKNYKISNYGSGHQIWFEAEDYDERNPDTNQYFQVVDQAGAFGRAMTRAGGAGGMIRYSFDISAAGGKAGTWYFWVRQINPNNQSDYMLVEGDPGDPQIPSGPPFPGGDGAAPFDNADDRILEETLGPPWTWGRSGHGEGHTKQLRNGKNTMYIFHRQGDSTVFWDVFMWTDDPAYRPTDDDYRNAKVLLPGTAINPNPGAGATDVPRDTALSWEAGKFAVAHDVYFGTAFADVNSATRTAAKGVLASQGQTATTFDPPGVLTYGQTYYWRIDEANKPSDNMIFKGAVWSFTVEPYAYPITPVAATASSAQANMGPEKTIDGSGMTGDLHGTVENTMWLSAGVQPNWIQYEFDKVYKLHEMDVWNSNQLVETFIGFGAKTVTIETSIDGAAWTPVANVPEFARATGAPNYAANTTVNLGSVEAKYVKLTINANWGGVAPQAGLSEVRFSYVPVAARAPQPANNAGGVSLSATLDWRPGRDVTSHKVFFGTDQAAVAAGTAPAKTVTEHGFDPGTLDFGTFYYWKVDEVGTATYPGEVWSFTTQPYQPVDDFESYTDQAGEEIFSTWVDGFSTGLNGSTVGYLTASGGTFGETRIVHGGRQSMPLAYDNKAAPFFSEAERTFDSAQNWTVNGADRLVVYFRGLAPGFAETASGSILMNAIGTDIWNNADQFRYAYKTLSGDGTMVARVDSVFNSNAWAKAGVMIRQSTDAGSVHAFMPITPGGSGAGNGASFQRRLTTGGASTNDDSTTLVAAPYWVKIERKGNSFSGYISPDGVAWTQLGTAQTIPMTNPVLIGLALCSHDAAIATSAAFSNVSTTGSVTGTWQVAEIGATQPAGNSVEGVYLSVKDSSGKTKVVQHPDAAATTYMSWQQWTIPLSEFTSAGVKVTAVKSMTVGVGNKAAPKAGGTGTVYIDDIQFGKPVQRVALPGEILIEAESATSITAPMAIYDDPLASGGKYIGTPTTQADSSSTPPTTGIAKIPFTVTGGKYKVILFVFIPGDNDSLWVRIAAGTTQTKNHASGWVRFNEIPPGEYWHAATVHSNDDGNQVVEWTLAPGTHTLEIAYREAGARVDAIVILSLN